jgi:hypothetical protein
MTVPIQLLLGSPTAIVDYGVSAWGLGMIRFALSGAVMALSLLVAQAQAAAPPAPFGLDVYGKEYALLSNSGWRASANGNATFVPVRVTSVIRPPAPGATDAEGRQQAAYMWARVCTASRQTVTFRRNYFLPGPPKTLGVDLWDSKSAVAPGNEAITSVKVYINGALAISLPGAYLRMPTAVRPHLAGLFRFGTNVVDVVVVKRAQNGNFGKCKYALPLGLYFLIKGAFEADFWLSPDRLKNNEQYVKGTGNTQLFIIGGSPRNLGPSGIYGGKLTVQIDGGEEITLDPDGPTVTGQGLTNCKLTQPFKQRGLLECDVYRMPKGALPRATFRALVRFPPGYAIGQVFIARDGYGSSFDPHYETNGKRDFFYICGPAAANPKCPP